LAFFKRRLYNTLASETSSLTVPENSPPYVSGSEDEPSQGASMSYIAWIILGLIAGFIGSKIVNKSGEGILLDIILGILGAMVGGFMFRLLGAHGVTGLNLYSLIVAVIGSVVFLLIYHALFRRSKV
jgi:uncharacterized membrane protein YeaQ/YmgE (transglycosylase-associated protein family)